MCAWQPVEERVEGGPEGSCQKPAPHLLEPGSTAIPSCRRVWEVMPSPDKKDAEGLENSLVTQLWGRSHETATIISQGQLLLIQHILKSPLLHPLREKPGPCGLCSGGLFWAHSDGFSSVRKPWASHEEMALKPFWWWDLYHISHELGRRKRQPTPAFLPGKSHGPGSLAGCSPCSRQESDTA